MLLTLVVAALVLPPSSTAQPIAVTMFDLRSNGEGTELAAFGLVWTAFMTLIAVLLYIVGRRSAGSLFETQTR